MKLRYILPLVALLPFSAMAQKEQSTSIIKAALRGLHVELRAGLNVGGTSPLPMPQEIREIKSYNPTLNLSLEANVHKYFEQSHWGMLLGVRLETKGMKTDARVKNYHMKMISEDGGKLEGAFTGYVKTNVNCNSVSVPVLITYSPNDRLRLSAGPYVGWMFNGSFTGSAYDGYIREGDPTGEKTTVTSATYDFSEDLRKMQWGLQAGVQWMAFKHLGVFADLQWGTSSIFPSDYTNVTFKLYPIYANFGVTYLF